MMLLTVPTCAVVGVRNVLDVVKHETGGGVRQEVQARVRQLNSRSIPVSECLRKRSIRSAEPWPRFHT